MLIENDLKDQDFEIWVQMLAQPDLKNPSYQKSIDKLKGNHPPDDDDNYYKFLEMLEKNDFSDNVPLSLFYKIIAYPKNLSFYVNYYYF